MAKQEFTEREVKAALNVGASAALRHFCDTCNDFFGST